MRKERFITNPIQLYCDRGAHVERPHDGGSIKFEVEEGVSVVRGGLRGHHSRSAGCCCSGWGFVAFAARFLLLAWCPLGLRFRGLFGATRPAVLLGCLLAGTVILQAQTGQGTLVNHAFSGRENGVLFGNSRLNAEQLSVGGEHFFWVPALNVVSKSVLVVGVDSRVRLAVLLRAVLVRGVRLLLGFCFGAVVLLTSGLVNPPAEGVDEGANRPSLVLEGSIRGRVGQQFRNREPSNLRNFFAGLGVEDGAFGDTPDDEQAHPLATDGGLNILVGVELVRDIVADLFEDFTSSTLAVDLLFADFPFGKTPCVGLAPSFNHQALGKVRGKQDSTAYGDLAEVIFEPGVVGFKG